MHVAWGKEQGGGGGRTGSPPSASRVSARGTPDAFNLILAFLCENFIRRTRGQEGRERGRVSFPCFTPLPPFADTHMMFKIGASFIGQASVGSSA